MELNNNTKETFKAIAKSSYGSFLSQHMQRIIDELGNIETIRPDSIESRKEAIAFLKRNTVDLLDLKEVKSVEPDTYQ